MTSDELYDLKKDPDEMINEINNPKYFSLRDEMHDALLEWQNETRDPLRGYYWAHRPWRNKEELVNWDYTGYTRQYNESKGEKKQLDYNTGLEIKEYVRKK